jgi:hypothetical protein
MRTASRMILKLRWTPSRMGTMSRATTSFGSDYTIKETWALQPTQPFLNWSASCKVRRSLIGALML